MNIPTDYPVNSAQPDLATETTSADITYAELKHRVDAKKPVTDEMIRTARARMDTAHLETVKTEHGKFKFSRIRNRFRAE